MSDDIINALGAEVEPVDAQALIAEDVTEDATPEKVSYEIPNADTDDEVEAAKAKGWVPEGVPGKPRKSARQYLRDGELIEAVMPLHKKIKDQEDALRKLAERAAKRDEEAKAKALAELTYKRDQAVISGDLESFHRTNAELAKVQAEQTTPAPASDGLTDEQRIAVSEFEARNGKWYNDNPENLVMKSAAITRAQEIATQIANHQLPALSASQQLAMVEDHIKRLYADKFENPNRSAPSAVSSGAVKADVKVKNTINSLNEYDKKSYEHIRAAMEKKGQKYTVDDFLKDF